jgi:Mrp family chromosome partitioning ATPase
MEAEPAAPAAALAFAYTQTRVRPDLLVRMRGIPSVVRSDRAPLAESFRMLRHHVLRQLPFPSANMLAFTSPRGTPARPLAALNLALTLAADLDTTVMLVDADLRGRGLSSGLAMGGEPGLAEHLREGTPLPSLLINPGVPRLVLLPCGRGGAAQSAEWLASRAAAQLVQELATRYPRRMVLFDLPPVLDSADALALLPLVGAALVVVEDHRTAVQDLATCAELLGPYRLLGSVLCQPTPAPSRLPWWRRVFASGRSARPWYASEGGAEPPQDGKAL